MTTIKQGDIVILNNVIQNLPSSLEVSTKVIIAKNKNAFVKNIVDEYYDISKPSDEIQKLRDGRMAVARAFAMKDKEGNIMIQGGNYTIGSGQRDAYKVALDAFNLEYKDVVEEERKLETDVQEWLRTDVDIDFIPIRKGLIDKMAKDLTPETLSALVPLFEADDAEKKEDK